MLSLNTYLTAVKGCNELVTLAIATHHLRISRSTRVYARRLTFSSLYAECNVLVCIAVHYSPGALLERIICRRYAARQRTRMLLAADTWLHYISRIIPLPPSNVSDAIENCVTVWIFYVTRYTRTQSSWKVFQEKFSTSRPRKN